MLAALCESPRLARDLLAVPGAKLHSEGSDGATVLFDVAHFEKVASIMQAKRRRQVSEEQKVRLRAAGKAYRFQPQANLGQDHGDKSQNDAIHGPPEAA